MMKSQRLYTTKYM